MTIVFKEQTGYYPLGARTAPSYASFDGAYIDWDGLLLRCETNITAIFTSYLKLLPVEPKIHV